MFDRSPKFTTLNQFTPENSALVLIASGSSHDLQEEMSRRRMEKAGVVLTTTSTIIAELVQDWSTKSGTELVKLLVITAPLMQPVEA